MLSFEEVCFCRVQRTHQDLHRSGHILSCDSLSILLLHDVEHGRDSLFQDTMCGRVFFYVYLFLRESMSGEGVGEGGG